MRGEEKLIVFDELSKRVTAPIVSLWTNLRSSSPLFEENNNSTTKHDPSVFSNHTEDKGDKTGDDRKER